MIAVTLKKFGDSLPLSGAGLRRSLAAGCAWGIAFSGGLAAMAWWKYGMICPDDIAVTTAISIVAGIVAIGPIAGFGRR